MKLDVIIAEDYNYENPFDFKLIHGSRNFSSFRIFKNPYQNRYTNTVARWWTTSFEWKIVKTTSHEITKTRKIKTLGDMTISKKNKESSIILYTNVCEKKIYISAN